MATPGPIAHHLYHGEDHPPILLGAAWYPELWDRDVWKRDIELMLEAGLNCVRIAEFAWAFMEPKAGEYAWDWLHDAVAVARDAGLSTILCTPTATPPAWMSRQHPEMLQHLHTQPRGMTHGGRRHYSPHSDIYRDHCRRICEVMGSEFKNEAGVIAWQIDNEVSGGGEFDVSDAARTAFHAWLEDRYQTIQNLNNTWNTGVWSQTYSAFDHVPLPTSGPGGGGTTHHPVLRFHFYRFTAEAWASFIRLQAEVLRRYVSQPITTNMIPYQGSDQHAVVDDLDFLSIDTYYQTDDDELHGNVWEMDWMRSAMPERNPWVMETWSTYNGGNVVGFGLQPEGAMRANAWTHVAAGAEAVLFWLWRGHRGGQETQHGSLVYAWGDPTYGHGECRLLAADLQKAAEVLREHPVTPAPVAVTHDWENNFQIMAEPRYARFTGLFAARSFLRDLYHRSLLKEHIHREVIDTRTGPSEYHRIIFSPWCPILTQEMIEMYRGWVESGGTWVVGPVTGVRTAEGLVRTDRAMGPLEELAGVRCVERIGQREAAVDSVGGVGSVGGGGAGGAGGGVRWRRLPGGEESPAEAWGTRLYVEAFDAVRDDVEVLATYDGWPVAGRAAVTSRAVGAGRVVVCGTTFFEVETQRVMAGLCREAGVEPVVRGDAGPTVLAVPRGVMPTGGPAATVLVEMSGKRASVELTRPGVDVLSDERVEGRVEVEAFATRVIVHSSAAGAETGV